MAKTIHIMFYAFFLSLCAACSGLPGTGVTIQAPRPLVAEGAPQGQRIGATPIITTALLGDSIIVQLGQAALPNSVNLAVSGSTVAQIQGELAHLPASITTIVMDGGTNDLLGLGKTPEQVKAAYVALLAAIPSNIKVELIGVPPVNEGLLKPGFNVTLNDHLVAETNALIRSVCAGNCSFIGSPFGHALTPQQTIDGIHLSAQGNAALVAAILHPRPSPIAWHSFAAGGGWLHHPWHQAMMHHDGMMHAHMGMPAHMGMMHHAAMHGGGHH